MRAAFWSVYSRVSQHLMKVGAFIFVEAFQPLLPYGLGFAAGAMIWMVFSKLISDALEEASSNLVAVIATLRRRHGSVSSPYLSKPNTTRGGAWWIRVIP